MLTHSADMPSVARWGSQAPTVN